ncbi:phage tail protein [Flavobacteriaceae bacterium W22]|uniref:phage tail protein n=1 Tax=Chryseobacterium binzhouense TaxID=2593646 RepID=UPI00136D890A|nr:tail fiber protein [Chryseobacterium binzhouense]MXS72901.1 phage tail protein [Flavobacteriaceae bacterium W22]
MDGTMSEIRIFAGDFAPKNWAFCQGQILNINTNQALFALLGTTYGGNGVTTFMLPNFAGRAPMGTGNAVGIESYQLGEMSGSEKVTCTLANMPTHTHNSGSETVAIKTFSDGGDTGSPTDNTLASLSGLYSNQTADTTLRPISTAFNLSIAGGSQPISVQQPYLGVNYIICLYGIFPSRS